MAIRRTDDRDEADMAYEVREHEDAPAKVLLDRALRKPDRLVRRLVIGEAVGRSPRQRRRCR